MWLDFEEVEGWTIVRPQDRAIECSTATEFRNAIETLLRQQHVSILLDFGKVEFVDSAGLGVLVSCKRALNDAQGSLMLANVRGTVRSVFEITGLDRIFTLASSIDEAIQLGKQS